MMVEREELNSCYISQFVLNHSWLEHLGLGVELGAGARAGSEFGSVLAR